VKSRSRYGCLATDRDHTGHRTVVSQREIANLPLNAGSSEPRIARSGNQALRQQRSTNRASSPSPSTAAADARQLPRRWRRQHRRHHRRALQNYNIEAVRSSTNPDAAVQSRIGRPPERSDGVTKTGTNDFEEDPTSLPRKSLNEESTARRMQTPSPCEGSAAPGKAPYNRNHTVCPSRPIIKDMIHFFATAERLERPTSYVITTGGSTRVRWEGLRRRSKTTWSRRRRVPNQARQFLQVVMAIRQLRYLRPESDRPTERTRTLTNQLHSFCSATPGNRFDKVNDFRLPGTHFKNAILRLRRPALIYPGVSASDKASHAQTTTQIKRVQRLLLRSAGQMRHDSKSA